MDARRALPIAAVLLLLASCSGGSAPHHPRPTSPASASPSASPEASRSTIDLATLSGRIVFDNHDDVWSINADGTGLTRLTDSPWFEFDATLSPDGTKISYRSDRNDKSELWLMNADGSGRHRLVPGGFPVWSPDGSKIGYAAPSFPSSIAVMNADGSGKHRVPHTTDGCEYPSWSPDWTRVVFNCNSSGEHLMYIVDVDGSRLVDLSGVGEGWQVDWSPDGRSILFASSRDHEPGWTDIYVMRPDGSEVTRLTYDLGYTPAWSPDGRYIVFSAGGLFVMRSDGSGITSLPVDGVGETGFPDWV
jgi:TolB protein